MNLSAIIDAMVLAGCTAEQLAAVVKAVEAERKTVIADKRKADAERQRRHRMSRDVTVTERESQDETVTPSLKVSPHTPLPKPNPLNPSKNNPKGLQKGSPSEALSTVLAPETAQAVVEHRQRMRAPLTFHAAELLARKLAACPDPQAAAEAMMANGWRGIDAAWLQRAQSPPNRKPNYVDALNEIFPEASHERPQGQIHNRDAERMAVLDWRPETKADDVFGGGG